MFGHKGKGVLEDISEEMTKCGSRLPNILLDIFKILNVRKDFKCHLVQPAFYPLLHFQFFQSPKGVPYCSRADHIRIIQSRSFASLLSESEVLH